MTIARSPPLDAIQFAQWEPGLTAPGPEGRRGPGRPPHPPAAWAVPRPVHHSLQSGDRSPLSWRPHRAGLCDFVVSPKGAEQFVELHERGATIRQVAVQVECGDGTVRGVLHESRAEVRVSPIGARKAPEERP